MSLYGVATSIYMPHLMESYSERYGLFGVTVALVGWLLCISFIVVAATVVAAEFDTGAGGLGPSAAREARCRRTSPREDRPDGREEWSFRRPLRAAPRRRHLEESRATFISPPWTASAQMIRTSKPIIIMDQTG